MLRNLVCEHELEAFVQITTLSSSDYQGAVHSSIKTLQPSQRYFQNNTGTHIMHLNTKKEKRKNTSTKWTKNGKIAFFGQGQPVHFDYLFSSLYFLFSHTLALFTRWLLDFWSRFPILKAYTALSTHSSSLFKSCRLNTSYYDYEKLTAKSSIFYSKSTVPSYSHILIYFIAGHRHWLFYIPVATYTEEEGQTQISSLFVQQRWFQSITWMSVERSSMTVITKLHLYCRTGYLASQALKSLLLYG